MRIDNVGDHHNFNLVHRMIKESLSNVIKKDIKIEIVESSLWVHQDDGKAHGRLNLGGWNNGKVRSRENVERELRGEQ